MFRSISVTIDGKEYKLRGEDEDLIQKAAHEVNEQLEMLKKKSRDDWPATTLPVLAALNIAERELEQRRKNENDINYFSNELDKMAEKLESALKR